MKKVFASVFALMLLILLPQCSNPTQPADPAPPQSWTIKYEVTGTASSLYILYSDPVYINNSLTTAPPWSFQFMATEGQWVYLQVDNPGAGSTTLTIYKDGAVWYTHTWTASGIFWIDAGLLF